MAKVPVDVLAKEGAVCRFRSAYSPRVRVAVDFSAGGRTKQSFKDECDINVIMRRYEKTGVLPFMEQRAAQYLDCTSVDYQEAMLLVTQARREFLDLPAGLRARFDNDPGELMRFLDDDRNREEAIQLGLVKAPEAPGEPLKVRVVPEPGAAPGSPGEPGKGVGTTTT